MLQSGLWLNNFHKRWSRILPKILNYTIEIANEFKILTKHNIMKMKHSIMNIKHSIIKIKHIMYHENKA